MKTFPLGAVLSVSTGIIVADFNQMHQLMEHLVGEPLFVHSLTVVAQPCAAELLCQHPQLGVVAMPDLNGAEECAAWVAEQAAVFGAELEIAPMGLNFYAPADPLGVLAARLGEDRVITLVLPERN